MKKHLHFINNSKGFVLPYVLFIATFVFIVLSANIKTYEHDIKLTEQHIEQLKIESIVQMGRAMVKNDLVNDGELQNVHYYFPYGEVTIVIVKLEHPYYHLHMTVLTENISSYTIRNRLDLNVQN